MIKNFVLIALFSVVTFGQTDGVVFRRSTANVIQTNLNQTFSTITNNAATASTLAGYDANKKLTTRQAVDADIASGAAVNANKIADGSVSNAEYELLDGITSIGNVDATAAFGTDNVVLRSDGTGRNAKSSSVSLDDSGNISTPGSGSFGVGSGNAGRLDLTEGSALALLPNIFSIYAPPNVAAGGAAFLTPTDAFSGLIEVVNSSGVMTMQQATAGSDYVAPATTLQMSGTANEVDVAGGTQDLSANRSWAFSLPSTIDLGAKTSFEIPNAASPTTDAFGEIAGDNNAWAVSRGAVQAFDGTANTYLVGALVSDAPINGQVPKWNTGGTITWEDVGSTATNFSAAVYGAGTAYSVTSTPALIDMGTTDPSLTLTNAGNYVLLANVGARYNGATFAGNQTLTVKLRKTSGSAADVSNASRAVTLSIVTTITAAIETIQIPPVFYSAAANDVIQVWAGLSATPSAGSVDVTSVELVAFTLLGGGTVTVSEMDGTPNVTGVTQIKVTNGTLTDEGGGVVNIRPAATVVMGHANGNYTDGTVIYMGAIIATFNAVSGRYAIPSPRTGTIVGYNFSTSLSTLGSAEDVEVAIFINSTTAIGATNVDFDIAHPFLNVTGLATAVTVGDILEFRITCPTFATNPVAYYIRGEVIIQ